MRARRPPLRSTSSKAPLRSWDEVGALCDPPISGTRARELGEAALLKMRTRLLELGVDVDFLHAIDRERDRAIAASVEANRDEVAGVTAHAQRLHDDTDPTRHDSLHDQR